MGPPVNRKLCCVLVAKNDSRLSIQPVAGRLFLSLACMMKPRVPVPISVKASVAPEVQTGLEVRRMVVCAMLRCCASCGMFLSVYEAAIAAGRP